MLSVEKDNIIRDGIVCQGCNIDRSNQRIELKFNPLCIKYYKKILTNMLTYGNVMRMSSNAYLYK